LGEYGASEAQLKRGAEQKVELKSTAIFGSLKHELRTEDVDSYSVVLYKLQYAKKLMGARNLAELNEKVRARITELELLAIRGKVKGSGTNDAIAALAEFAWRLPDKDIWKVLTLTLAEPNPGLRLAPDLARALVLEGSPDYAVRKYKEEARRLGRKARISYRARSISYFRKDCTPKEGPEHFVPIVESEIDWRTGTVKGKYLFYMLRYEKDTCINGKAGAVANRVLQLNPTPEYEGIGFRFALGEEDRLTLAEIELRAHWVAIRVPAEMAERTSDGRIKVTAVPDSKRAIKGHMILVVLKDPEVCLSTIKSLNPQFELVAELRHPENAGSEVYFFEELLKARYYYDYGHRYAVRGKLVMEESGPKTDPCSKSLIPWLSAA
jgi:hypothetical protein